MSSFAASPLNQSNPTSACAPCEKDAALLAQNQRTHRKLKAKQRQKRRNKAARTKATLK
jgi:hypothetical protein